jgi:small subunit ribosomal protein S4
MSLRGPKEKKERALGTRLGLKGDRALSPKSAMVRKPYKPGVHGPRGRAKALSEFGLQLREKAKFKIMYGINENNLKEIFRRASAAKGALGAKMLELLEVRLDNVIFQLGWTPSRAAARQLVVHGHIFVNKKKVKSPSFEVRKGDIITVNPNSAELGAFTSRKEVLAKYDAPSWLRLDAAKMEGEMLSQPVDINSPFEINLLVDSFSK